MSVLDIPDAPINMTTFDMSDYIDTDQLCKGFGRTGQTIYLWRTNKGLPYTEFPTGKKPVIRFKLDEILDWAQPRGLEFDKEAAGVEAEAL